MKVHLTYQEQPSQGSKFEVNYRNESKEIIKNHNTLSKNVDRSNYKIIFMIIGEDIKMKPDDTKAVEDLIKISTNTNTVVIGIPFLSNRPVLNKFIEKCNKTIKK